MTPPVVLTGFMGAGKTTAGRLLADRLATAFVDVDDEIERTVGRPVADIFAIEGEEHFRALERSTIERVVARGGVGVVALGGGALGDHATCDLLAAATTVAFLDLDVETCLARIGATGRDDRPLARDEQAFRALYAARRSTYEEAAQIVVDARPAPEIVAAALAQRVCCGSGLLERLPAFIGTRRAVAVIDDAVAERVRAAGVERVVIPGGEEAKSIAGVDRLWRALAATDVERGDLLVAIGGGAVTDVAGFAAATFRRGIAWIACPTTVVGQVDAAIGGKTAIDVATKNDVGAFHLPEAVLCDPDVLATLPLRQVAAGHAEIVKTALLAGGELHADALALERGSTPGSVLRRCAAFKAGIVAADPREQGVRAILNLGHTIGHGVEAAAAPDLLHGEAVAIGLVAALELSIDRCGLDEAVVAAIVALFDRLGLPHRAPGVDPDAVVAVMRGDKKRVAGGHRFVLLEAPGAPVTGVRVDDAVVRAAVERVCTDVVA